MRDARFRSLVPEANAWLEMSLSRRQRRKRPPTKAALEIRRAIFVEKFSQLALLGSIIIFVVTTILAVTGWDPFFQDGDVLFFLRVASLLAFALTSVGLMVARKSPK